MAKNTSSSKIIQSHCNRCGADKKHHVRGMYRQTWSDVVEGGFDIDGGSEYFILECAGCEEVTMRRDSWFSEDYEAGPDGYQLNISKTYYPPRTFRQKPSWFEKAPFLETCPEPVRELFDEAYICMQNKCTRSTAMAIRAILEAVMVKNVGDRGTFEKNITAFEAAGHIAARDRVVFSAVIDGGSAAIHRTFKPSDDDLVLCMDIAERIAQRLYVHEIQVKSLKRRIPKRKKPKKTPQASSVSSAITKAHP